MTREQFDKLYNDKAVWCKTEALAKEFLKLAHSVGYKWATNESLIGDAMWWVHSQETVYFIDNKITYGDRSSAKPARLSIVKFVGKSRKPQEQPRVFDAESLAFEVKQIDNHLSPLDPLITGLIDVVKVEDLPKVKELREHYEKMSEIIESLKGE